MDQIGKSVPQVTAVFDAEKGTLEWRAFKSSSLESAIETVTVNGWQINTASGTDLSGSFPVKFNGLYTFDVKDVMNNTTTLTVEVTGLALEVDPAFTFGFTDDGENGTVTFTVDADAGITGGSYDPALSSGEKNEYRTSYQTALIRLGSPDETPSAQNAVWTDKPNAVITEPGCYVIAAKAGEEIVFSDPITVTASESRTAPGCETDGAVECTVTAVIGGKTAEETHKMTLAAVGHKWGEPTYAWSADNGEVTAERICGNDPTHKETETVETKVSTKDPICTAGGTVTYTAEFENPAFEDQTRTLTVEALGHSWGKPDYKWSDDCSTVTAERVCRHDETHREKETAAAISVVREPTCTEAGAVVYTAAFENSAFETQTKTVERGEPLGHLWGEPVYTWAEDNSTVTASRICGRDESHAETETVPTDAETRGPLCDEDGSVTYTAVFANEAFVPQTKTVTLEAPGHDWSEPEFVWSSDKTSAKAKVTCRNDPAHKREFNTTVRTDSTSFFGTIIWTATVVIDGEVYRDVVRETVSPWIPRIPVTERIVPEVDEPDEGGEQTEPVLPFTDVKPEDPFFDDVKYVFEKEIMNGVSATEFAPLSDLSRGMIVTVLYRMEGEPAADGVHGFTDVPADQWYSEGVAWAASAGIVLGYGDGTYRPGNPVTREQLAAILNRYAEYRGYAIKSGSPASADEDSISGWARENVGWAAANGILKADGEGNLRPTEPASRAEIAGAIRAFLETVAG